MNIDAWIFFSLSKVTARIAAVLFLLCVAPAVLGQTYIDLKRTTDAAIKQKRWPEAIESAERMAASHPDDPLAFKQLGFALWRAGQEQQALTAYRHAILLAPGTATAWNNVCWYETLLGNVAPAREACKSGIKADPNHRSLFTNLGHTYLLEGDTDSAYRWYSESLLRTPNEKVLQEGLMADLDLLIARDVVPGQSRRAQAWVKERFMAGDMQQLRDAQKKETECEIALNHRRLDYATKLCLTALEMKESILGTQHIGLISTLTGLATVEYQQKRLDTALRYLDRVAEIEDVAVEPDNLYVANRLSARAAIEAQQQHFQSARDHLTEALSIRRKQTGSLDIAVAQDLNNLGIVLEATGKPADAIPLVKEAAAITETLRGPNGQETKVAQDNLARLLVATGQVDQWIRTINKEK